MTISNISGLNNYGTIEKTYQKKEIEPTKELSKVDEIKKQINEGTYKLDMNSTAKKILESLI